MKTSAQRRSGKQPTTRSGFALSKRHLQDSVAFNRKHAQEHMSAAQHGDKSYHKDHAKAHYKAMKEDVKELKQLAKAVKKKGY